MNKSTEPSAHDPQVRRHHRFMQQALELARSALSRGEFPVGCVIVANGQVVAAAARNGSTGAVASEIDHAEMLALKQLESRFPGQAVFDHMTLYSTMEPCLMCWGAILIRGIGQVVWAYEDVMGGAAGCDRSCWPPLYRQRKIDVVGGVMRDQSLELFARFFRRPDNAYWKDSLLARYTLEQFAAVGRGAGAAAAKVDR